MYGEINTETYMTTCTIESQWEFAMWVRKLKWRLCNNLEGWDGEGDEGRSKRKQTCVYLWLTHVDIWQKTTIFYKIIILQLKNKLIFLSGEKWKPSFKHVNKSIPQISNSVPIGEDND